MIERIGRFLDRNNTEFLLLLTTLFYTLGGYYLAKEGKALWDISYNGLGWFLIILCVLIHLIIIRIQYRGKKEFLTKKALVDKIKELEKTNELVNTEYYRLCSDFIKWTFNELDIAATDRISIYKHHGDHFTLLGRYSKNPSYNKPNRSLYPDNLGFISLAWNAGAYYINDIPKYIGNGREWKDYIVNKCPIDRPTLQSIKMKSRAFYIKTLHDDATSEDPDGIIVFESLEPSKLIKEDIDSILEKEMSRVLSLLKNMKTLTKKLNSKISNYSVG